MRKTEIMKKVMNNVCNNSETIENPQVGEKVYVTDFDNYYGFFLEEAYVRKIRKDECERVLGIEFKRDVGGHSLDGASQDGHGLWIDIYNTDLMISTRNMEKFYTRRRVKKWGD